jgi:hypothetical protein
MGSTAARVPPMSDMYALVERQSWRDSLSIFSRAQRRGPLAGSAVLFVLAAVAMLRLIRGMDTYPAEAVGGLLLFVLLFPPLVMYVSHRQKVAVAKAVKHETAFWGCWLYPQEVLQDRGGPLTVSDTEIRWQPSKKGRAAGLKELRLARADIRMFELPRVRIALRNNIRTMKISNAYGDRLN